MAADSYPTTPVPRAGDEKPAGTDTLRPVSFAALFVQDLPKLPSLAALRALTDHELPSTDGLPMPESTVQGPPLRYTVSALDWVFKARRPGTCVAGDLFVYSEGRPDAEGRVRPETVAPDVLVAFGVGERLRDSYVMWQEDKPPDFVMEIASESTWKRDRDEKPARYASLGVGEYFLYDPVGGRLEPRLQGYALHGGRYRRLREERLGNGERGVCSPVLGLCAWLRGPRQELRWYDPVTGRNLEDYDEAKAGRDAAEERTVVAEDRARAAEDRARAAEAEVAALLAQVRRLQRGPGT